MFDHGLAPLAVGFCVALLTTPAGVSGAFLLVPVQVSLLDITSPALTPTNLLFNVFSTPGGILTYRRQRHLDVPLVKTILLGTVPGVILGSILRVTVFEGPETFKAFVGVVLILLGSNLVLQVFLARSRTLQPEKEPAGYLVSSVAAGAGLIGGIYGISGGSIIAPALAGIWGLPVRRVAPAVLVSTLFTSAVGVLSFQILDLVASEGDPARRPDWILAATFGLGGIVGSAVGARFSKHVPDVALRVLLGVIAAVLGVTYVVASL